MDVAVEMADGLLQVLHGNQHVLDHMMLLVQLADGLSLRQLQQGDFGRHHPAKEISEDGVVPEWDNVLGQGECNLIRQKHRVHPSHTPYVSSFSIQQQQQTL